MSSPSEEENIHPHFDGLEINIPKNENENEVVEALSNRQEEKENNNENEDEDRPDTTQVTKSGSNPTQTTKTKQRKQPKQTKGNKQGILKPSRTTQEPSSTTSSSSSSASTKTAGTKKKISPKRNKGEKKKSPTRTKEGGKKKEVKKGVTHQKAKGQKKEKPRKRHHHEKKKKGRHSGGVPNYMYNISPYGHPVTWDMVSPTHSAQTTNTVDPSIFDMPLNRSPFPPVYHNVMGSPETPIYHNAIGSPLTPVEREPVRQYVTMPNTRTTMDDMVQQGRRISIPMGVMHPPSINIQETKSEEGDVDEDSESSTEVSSTGMSRNVSIDQLAGTTQSEYETKHEQEESKEENITNTYRDESMKDESMKDESRSEKEILLQERYESEDEKSSSSSSNLKQPDINIQPFLKKSEDEESVNQQTTSPFNNPIQNNGSVTSPNEETHHEHGYHRMPKPQTNISHITEKIADEGKHFALIGLNYECHVFDTVDELTHHIGQTPNQFTDRSYDPKHAPHIWVDIQAPSVEDMKAIESFFFLHPLTTEDCLHSSESNDKWEHFQNYLFVVFNDLPYTKLDKNATLEELFDRQSTMNILVFNNYVITIHEKPLNGLYFLIKRIEAEFELPVKMKKFGGNHYKKKKDNQGKLGDLTNPAKTLLSSDISVKYDVNRSFKKAFASPASFEDLHHKMDYEIKKTFIPSADWVLYAYIDAITDLYIPEVDILASQAEDIEHLIMYQAQKANVDMMNTNKPRQSFLKRFYRRIRHGRANDDESNEKVTLTPNELLFQLSLTKKNVREFRRLIEPKQKICTYISSRAMSFLTQATRIYLRDVVDHLSSCLETLDEARENINQTHSQYMLQVSMSIAASSSRTDIFMNRISILAAILGPLSLISGIWGMNVQVPFQQLDNVYPFLGIVTFMIVSSLFLIVIFNRKLIGYQ